MRDLTVPAILWLCVCVLADTPRQRELCMVGTLVLMVVAWLLS